MADALTFVEVRMSSRLGGNSILTCLSVVLYDVTREMESVHTTAAFNRASDLQVRQFVYHKTTTSTAA